MSNISFPIIEFLNTYAPIEEEVKKEIISALKFESIKKGETLIKKNRVCNRIYFLNSGVVRSFFYKEDKDITYWIYAPNQMLTSWNSFINQTPASDEFEATDDSELCSLTHEQWCTLCDTHPSLNMVYRKILETEMANIDEFYKGYYFMTAKEKYDLLLTVFPEITQIANLKHIASMMGITQETLSRIRGMK